MVGGVCGRGCAWQGVACVAGGVHGRGACMTGGGGSCVADTTRYSQ